MDTVILLHLFNKKSEPADLMQTDLSANWSIVSIFLCMKRYLFKDSDLLLIY